VAEPEDSTRRATDSEEGFYWINLFGAAHIAELDGGAWWLPGSDVPLTMPPQVLDGPLSPPQVPDLDA
jgi:hypothetical protein